MEKYLNNCLEIFMKLLIARNFSLVNVENSSVSFYKDFENQSFKFRIMNDRGVIETFLASKDSNHFFNFELVVNFLKSEINPDQNPKINHRLNLNELNEYFNENYLEIVYLFETNELEALQNKIYRNAR